MMNNYQISSGRLKYTPAHPETAALIPTAYSRDESHNRHSNNRRRAAKLFSAGSRALLILLSLSLLTLNGWMQERQPERGIQFANSYVAGDIDAVNVSNGNVVINLPLASLPKGRGTSPGFTVTLQYNSKLWDSKQTIFSNQIQQGNGDPVDTSQNYSYSSDKLEMSERGGWRMLSSYQLKWINRLNLEAPDPCLRGEPVEKISARWKIELEFPDGSVRQFVPTYGATAQSDGFYNIDYNGTRYTAVKQISPVNGLCSVAENTQQITTGGMNYITTDGSRLRLFIPYAATTNLQERNWKIYAADGTVIENQPPDDAAVSQRVTDRNQSKIEIRGNQIVDHLGRNLTVSRDAVTVKGINGDSLTTQIQWGTRYVHRKYKAIGSGEAPPTGTERYDETYSGFDSVEQITLPSQAGGQSYTFEYYADAAQKYGTDYTDGWGELKSVTFPAGAKAVYTYQSATGTEATAFDVLSNNVSSKDLTYTEDYDGTQTSRTEKTLYETGYGYGSNVLAPSGAVSGERTFYSALSVWNNGLAYRTHNPDGSFTERIWQVNLPVYSGNLGLYNYASGNANAYVKTEFNTIVDAGNQPTLTAIKDYNYDKNGNVTRIAEYDWVDYNSVPRSNTQPTGIPAGAAVKRITENEYYNQTPDADSTAASANTYENPGAPKLKNVLKSTEIKDAAGSVVSRAEFYYDDASNTGNLTEAKTWDSSKGAYSNPLTAENSVSVTNQYDVYGNLTQTTDARGIVSKSTYGDIGAPGGAVSGLYPTESVAAFGTTEARTTRMEYDFSTGAVKKVTDADNNVSTETEYDALARPTKTKAAAGTANEIWTQTVYDDVNRRVIAKSDIEIKGDGRKVSVQHFDQLGRVRLSRTLEDAATQSATDETQGIKVQTRYRFDNPTDPANSNGSYSLTSNPYRAATATQATSEEAMGWTVSYADKTGRNSTAKTYGGATLPAPFGANSNTTGTMTTAIDANTTTVTDQAGKQRRSVTNALGQLARVDEPNDNGEFGAIDSPATIYSYDVSDNLIQVVQSGQTRNFTYDSLDRLKSADNPESGTVTYSYDANNNVVGKQDARNVVTNFTYDALNRPKSKVYSDSTPTIEYFYDNSAVAFSKGKLTKIGNSNSISEYTGFDALGKTLSSRQTTDNQSYSFGYAYDLSGNLIETTYPSGRKVKNTFDADADLSKVETMPVAGSYQTRADNFAYFASGAISSMKLGNNGWESSVLNSRLQPTQIALGTTQNATDLLKLEYAYGTTDNNGNVKSQIITVPNGFTATQNYTYDSLNRLKTAVEIVNSAQAWKQTFVYDRFGNRTFDLANTTVPNQSGAVQAVINPSVDSANNRFTTGQGYTYDTSGNLTQDAENRKYLYDGENKQTELKDAATNQTKATYSYDGDGRRVKKTVAATGEQTVFVYDADGDLAAEYLLTALTAQTPTTQYLTNDSLGSPRIITDGSGNVVSRRDFLPFGEDLTSGIGSRTSALKYDSDNIRQKFTGKQRDTETNLDFFEARYFSPRWGRFTSPDEFTGGPEELIEFDGMMGHNPTFYAELAEPQSLNKYHYALNNPLRYIDPDGHQTTTADRLLPAPWWQTVDPATAKAVGREIEDIGNTLLEGFKTIGRGIARGVNALGNAIGNQDLTCPQCDSQAEFYRPALSEINNEMVKAPDDIPANGNANNTAKPKGSRNPKTASAAAEGRKRHKEFAEKVKAKKGWQSEPSLKDPKTGRIVRPDAVTRRGKPVELKPNTPSGRKKGERQLKGQERATGKKGKVIYYDPKPQ